MTKFNIQFTANNELEFTQSFKNVDTSHLTSEEITELCKNLLTTLVNKLEEKKEIKRTKTIIKPYGVIFKIDNVQYDIKKFSDALIYTFKYLIDNNYINDEHSVLTFSNKSKKILYCKKEDVKKYKLTNPYNYKKYIIELNMDRSGIKLTSELLMKHFKIQKKLLIKNWPK